jgi:hypothetical protein
MKTQVKKIITTPEKNRIKIKRNINDQVLHIENYLKRPAGKMIMK